MPFWQAFTLLCPSIDDGGFLLFVVFEIFHLDKAASHPHAYAPKWIPLESPLIV